MFPDKEPRVKSALETIVRRADLIRELAEAPQATGRTGAPKSDEKWFQPAVSSHLHDVRTDLAETKIALNILLDPSHYCPTTVVAHDKLETSIGGLYNEGMSQRENMVRLSDLVDRELRDVKRRIQEQVHGAEAIKRLPITKALADTPLLPVSVPPTCHSSSSSLSRQSFNSRRASPSHADACRPQCQCACHMMQRLAIPPFLSPILGRFVLEHAGIPGIGIKCDTLACIKAQPTTVYAEYWFPIRTVWSKIIRFHATYQVNLGPSLQLHTLRLVPDSAPAVSFAINGNIEGLKGLFGRGAASPCDVSETRGYSLMRWALYSRQYKMVRFLHAAGADADYRPKALHDNSPSNKAADALMMGGLSGDIVDDLSVIANKDWVEEQNFPLLHRIVLGLHGKDLEEALSEDPSSVDREDAMGRTALNWAAARGDDRSVAALLSYAADPNILDCQHSGPLSSAAEKNHTVCVRILLEAGAQPDPVIPGGQLVGSPLNCASRNASDPVLIKSLLDFGADVDASGVDGRTALMHAARTDNVSFALLFLEHNANINAVSTAGQTPLTTAIVNNSHRVLTLLLSRWADYSACTRLRGPHLLETAAQFADHETLTILCSTNHIRLKCDKNYHAGDFDKVLLQRHDRNEKLDCAFADFMSIVREEVSPESRMEKGMAFDDDDGHFPDVSDEKSSSGDEFFDSAEHLLD